MRFPFEIPAANDFDVVGFGTNAVDHLIRVPEFPAFNSKIEIIDYSQAAGGEAASTMVGLQKLGFQTAYVGRFGDDAAGELGRLSLESAGVDISYSATIPAARTQIAYIIIDERNGERTIIWHRDPKLAYSAAEAPTAAAKRGRIMHITPHDVSACCAMAVSARESGVVVSIDVDNVFDGIDELLPLVDVCIASAEFSNKMFGASDTHHALREINSRYGCRVVGLTLGSAGSVVFCRGTFIETPGFEVPGRFVDTTGAGDAFRAGFLFGMLSGLSVEESAVAANAVAALKCRSFGARSGLPDKTELEMLIKNF